MAYTTFNLDPGVGTETDATQTLSAECTANAYPYHQVVKIVIWYRINSGSWLSSTTNFTPGETKTATKSLFLGDGSIVQWYAVCTINVYAGAPYTSPIGTIVETSTTIIFQTSIDTTDPTFGTCTPADAASVAPTSSGITFSVTASDDYGIDTIKFYVDTVLKSTASRTAEELTTTKTYSITTLEKGAHTWYAIATDESGNDATLTTRDLTVTNALPTAPGTPSVEGLSTVADEIEYTVSWTAATDYNPEDTLTYKLEMQENGGAWSTVADSIAGLTQAWTPHTVGTAGLRVSATDGTGYGSVSSTRTVTVASTSAPNNPTISEPSGGETLNEGETFAIEWAKASPEHPDALTCIYEGEFSAAGTFADSVSIFSGLASTTSYSWTLAATLVAGNTATCKVRVRSRDTNGRTSAWTTSSAFTVNQNTVPTVTLVTPTDAGTIQGPAPLFVFLVDDVDDDAIHIELQVSEYSDFRTYIVDTDSTTDYAYWEEAADPFSTWTTVDSAGATHDYRVRYQSLTTFRYDGYYGRVRVTDGYLTSDWTEFTFDVIPDATSPLSVTIGGNVYRVTALKITENTGGEPSPITMSIPLGAFLAEPLEEGDAVTVGSGLGGFARSWNATVETINMTDNGVEIYCLQDDVLLSRLLATGDEAAADIGANLSDFITSYGGALTGTAIDTTAGVTMALTGGFKMLREHFDDAIVACPDYIYWVDTTGDVHFVDQDDLTSPTFELYEEDPS